MDRRKSAAPTYRLSPLELIFDIVIVFACSELTKHLLEHFTVIGVIEILIILVAVYNLWTYTSFGATLIHGGDIASRWIVFVVMLLGIFLNSGIGKAYGTNAWIFLIPYLTSQLGQGFYIMIFAKNKGLKQHYRIMTVWNLITTPIWIIGALSQYEIRIILWGVAALIDLIGIWFAHPAPKIKRSTENVQFDAEHMLERCRLFLIIALGEAVFTLIEALIENQINYITLLLGVASFIAIISMWALYFWGSDHLIARYVEATKNAVRTAHLTMNSLFITIAGLILFSVGTRIIIENPLSYNSPLLSGVLFGGPILYIAAQGWYMWYVLKQVPLIRIVISVVLIALGLLSFLWPSYIALILVMAALTVLTFIVIYLNKKRAQTSVS